MFVSRQRAKFIREFLVSLYIDTIPSAVKFAGVFLISLLYDLFMQISLKCKGTAVPGKIKKQT